MYIKLPYTNVVLPSFENVASRDVRNVLLVCKYVFVVTFQVNCAR